MEESCLSGRLSEISHVPRSLSKVASQVVAAFQQIEALSETAPQAVRHAAQRLAALSEAAAGHPAEVGA